METGEAGCRQEGAEGGGNNEAVHEGCQRVYTVEVNIH